MNVHERAAFHEELGKRGIISYQSDEEYAVRKVRTDVDPREFLDGHNYLLMFDDQDAANAFIKHFIDWSYQDDPKQVEPVKEARQRSFSAIAMVNLGFGNQVIELGKLTSDCVADDWYSILMDIAVKKAQAYMKKNYPDRDWEKLPRNVKVLPCAD